MSFEDDFLLSAWRVSQCDRLAMYGERDYVDRVHRADTPPDVGFIGSDYAGLLILGLNPGRGLGREENEQDYFDLVGEFSRARTKKSALAAGRRVLAAERKSAEEDPWRFYEGFVLRLLLEASAGSDPLSVENIVRLNIARSKTVSDSATLTVGMGEICFNAHTREQIALVQPKVIICRYQLTHDWLQKWAADLTDTLPVEVVRGRAPRRADMARAGEAVREAIKT